MKALLSPLHELGEFEEIRTLLKKPGKSAALTGCMESQKLHMMYGIGDGYRNRLIITFSDLRVREIQEDYRFYDRNVTSYPARDLIFYQADIHSNQLTKERIKCMRRMLEGKPVTVVTTFSSLMSPQIPLAVWKDHIIAIGLESEVNEKALAKRLLALGYEKNYQVEAPGHFSNRRAKIYVFDT